MDRLAVILTLCVLVPGGGAKIVYVDASATGDGNGSDWANACTTITPGLVAAATGDEVWVKSATYAEAIVLRTDVALYGGFPADGSPTFELRDWAAYGTIIDASGFDTSAVSVYGVTDATIDGFTITGGSAARGAGIYCENSSPILKRCTIAGNRTEYVSDWHIGGAGILCATSAPVLSECIIQDNQGLDGGGVYCLNSSPILNNCVIQRNTCAALGGAIASREWSSPVLENCLITDNQAGQSGGVMYCYESTSKFTNCTMVKNESRDGSGGISVYVANLGVTNCILWNGGNEIETPDPDQIAVRASCIQGSWPGEDNIDADPLFVDWQTGDYHLQDNSPCIDRGFPSDAPGVDIEGHQRPGGDGLFDVGAYESPDGYLPGQAAHTARVVYVRAGGAEGGDGLSWETAFTTVGAALRVTSTSDEVWVGSGTYRETVHLEPGIPVFGGFGGDETSVEKRNWGYNPTVIDVTGLNSRGVVAARDSSIDGFTITGGRARAGGGIVFEENSPGSIANCLITGNRADFGGGGVHIGNWTQVTITNCAIVKNTAGVYGGGIFNFFGKLLNCTVAGNSAGSGFGAILGWSGMGFNCVVWGNVPPNLSPDAVLNWSDVEGGCSGVGNINEDPLFVNPEEGDFRLSAGSPCIDRGSNGAAGGIPFDLDGNIRVRDGDDIPGSVVDMGAYEFDPANPSPTPIPGDTNGDDVADALDLFFFSQWWKTGKNETNFLCDVVQDDMIDQHDLLQLAQEWR